MANLKTSTSKQNGALWQTHRPTAVKKFGSKMHHPHNTRHSELWFHKRTTIQDDKWLMIFVENKRYYSLGLDSGLKIYKQFPKLNLKLVERDDIVYVASCITNTIKNSWLGFCCFVLHLHHAIPVEYGVLHRMKVWHICETTEVIKCCLDENFMVKDGVETGQKLLN